jgi:O-antigen/teichoic acid export membrane protein
MGYQQHAVAGFSWQSLQKIITAGLSFAKIFVLARLLTPEQFGLFSLIMITLGTTESVTQTGVNVTILQSKQPVQYFLDTAYVIAIIRGLVIGSLMVAMGYFMANYYQEPDLFPMITVISLVPIIKGFINPAIVSWQKNFNFAKDSSYHLLRLLVEALAQIALAWWLQSVWALVLGIIISALFEVFLSFVMLAERPVFHYIKSRGSQILHNARWLSASSLLNYLNDNLDDFLLGKVFGTHQLGIYHNAYALSHKANYEFSKSAYHGVAPIFNRLVQNREESRLRRAFFKTMFSTLLLVTGVSLPLLIWPETLIVWFLGQNWLAAASVLPWLTLAGIVHSLANIIYALLIAKKHYLYLNTHLLINVILMIVGIIYLGNRYGFQGAIMGVLLARLIALPIIILGARKALHS